MTDNFTTLQTFLTQQNISFLSGEPMSRHTTFQVGGPAELFIEPRSVEEMKQVQHCCRSMGVRLFCLGRGSNLLVGDEGLPWAVLHLGDGFSGIERLSENALEVRSGTKLATLCTAAAEAGLSGLEFAYGIPGAVGGGVYMNAGAYGGELACVVQSVTFLSEAGELCTRSGAELEFSYRHSYFSGKGCIILSAVIALTPGDPAAIRLAMEDYMSRRRAKQPLEYGSAGSTFKRPTGAFAGALIEQCGLKGYTVGRAQVSEKHAGFVINLGGASSAEIHAVLSHVARTVKVKTGFTLEPEILLLP